MADALPFVRTFRLARLAMRLVRATVRAELLQLEAIGVVATVLLGDVVAVLAHGASQRDLRADVARLLGHLSHSIRYVGHQVGSGNGT